jgi:hypothetical protein
MDSMESNTAPAPPRHFGAIPLLVVTLSQLPLDLYPPALPQLVVIRGAAACAKKIRLGV